MLGAKRVAQMGRRGLAFYDLAKDTGGYRGHGSRKADLDESDNDFVGGGMTEWACYLCRLTFGGDKALVPITSNSLIKTANVAGSRNFSSSYEVTECIETRDRSIVYNFICTSI